MRVSPQKKRLLRMKPSPKKDNKKNFVSETISFVIKGKLTPIKTPYKKKKMTSTKTKDGKKTTASPDKKAGDTKKGVVRKTTPLLKNSTKKFKKDAVETTVKSKKKKIAVKPPVKKSDTNKETEDLKTKQTIEKLLKQANRALKPQKTSKKVKNKQPVTAEKKTTETKRKSCGDAADEPDVKKIKTEPKTKKMTKKEKEAKARKLFGIWNGPKRHRVASLNALAKVHCLYENETRGPTILDAVVKKQESEESDEKPDKIQEPITRTLRSFPGLRAVGKHWDMHDTSSSSEDNASDFEIKPKLKIKKESSQKLSDVKKKRNRNELMMDLKDMVVRKRMASLNASAILAASYSVEKRPSTKSPKRESEIDSSDYFITDTEEEESRKVKKEAESVIEVKTSPSKKVAVILNQDTDVTITGVYVNSTTRSTHHEGYCSIAGMQYRISATSHTQTAATAVATETLLQSSSSSTQENSNSDSCKSYTPLDALSNMQPPPGPGIQHHQHMRPPQHVLSSPGRRHCPSAFSAPHGAPPYHHPPAISADAGYVHGYYQPAGPLINVAPPPPVPPSSSSLPPSQPAPAPPATSQLTAKSAPLSDTSPASSPLLHQPHQSQSANTSNNSQTGGESSDGEVIITSVTAAAAHHTSPAQPPHHIQPAAAAYRYHYPGAPAAAFAAHHAYPPHYYPPPTSAPSYAAAAHHDLCYSAAAAPYLHHKYAVTTPPPPMPPQAGYHHARRYQYYGAPPPQQPQTAAELYATGAVQQPPQQPSAQNQQVVTATPSSVSSGGSPYQAPAAIMEPYPPPPPPTLVETYPHPSHYYPSYGPVPPPPCYSHPPATRTIPYLNTTYQSCPCPMQSCPKNVHIGPLTGDSKRSNISAHISKDSIPLPPVALALPLEPASATGPPSPARGSAGMPPPPSPAGATYQTQQPPSMSQSAKQESTTEQKRKARVGKAMVRENISAANTMLLMLNPDQREVKREIESPKQTKKEICSSDDDNDKVASRESMKTETVTPEDNQAKTQLTQVEEPKDLEELEEERLPCVKTVAENVKVKNMKRKSSKELAEAPTAPPAKKVKVEKPVGTYKDLIKKDTSTVKINNGRRKLIEEEKAAAAVMARSRKITRRKQQQQQQTKRKLLVKNAETSTTTTTAASSAKRAKTLKENKEPPVVKLKAKLKESAPKAAVAGNNGCKKKTAPVLLDGLLEKNKVTNNGKSGKAAATAVVSKKEEIKRRRSKCKEGAGVPAQITRGPSRRNSSLSALPRWSNGWKWEGEPYDAKVFLNSDETTVLRRCYPAMRHEEGDKIEARDCVLLKAGPRKNDLPFVAKIAYLWENPDDGEMMMSLLWYYRPEHTEQGRQSADQPDEVFASRHKDSNSVACIDDKCYVLTFHEYCRYRKDLKRVEEGLDEQLPCIPLPEPYPRLHRQPPPAMNISPDMVFFCRRVYDFRQKRIVKNPS